ncbi:MAG: hypothetical protein CSA66_04770 [Proteobacteria bacterium]|nr:MAG: hypothetical protein CSA66_04770 [Pseudomonadota bacterium]
MKRAAAGLLAALAFAAPPACTYGTSAPPLDKVNPALVALSNAEPIALADRLEGLIAEGRDTSEDREFAYWVIAQQEPGSAPSAFARASTAGRVAELKGLNAGVQVAEAERYAAVSRRLDPDFRQGAAQALLGSLYVHAPASMVAHGDSEKGLTLLREVHARWPDNPRHRLRLAEAYVALGDDAPAYALLCWCRARADVYRADERALLVQMLDDVDLEAGDCE